MTGKLLDTTVLIDLPDALIAATAITQGFELASDNARHFRMIAGLAAERPY